GCNGSQILEPSPAHWARRKCLRPKKLRPRYTSPGCREFHQGCQHADTIFSTVPKIDRRRFREVTRFYANFSNSESEVNCLTENFRIKDKCDRISQKRHCFEKFSAIGTIARMKF